jgi:Integrase core domain.
MRQAIVDLKAEYPDFTPNELATIGYVQFDRRLSRHTVQRILAEGPPPSRTTRRYPPYAQIPDSAERRLAVIRLHAEGWSISSISRYLEVSRPTVYLILSRWIEEGVKGLEEKSRAPKSPARKVTLEAMHEVKRLQLNPELGEWRIHAALKMLGIHLSPRTCGRILALNRSLYGLKMPRKEPHESKPYPYKAEYRHHIWSVDLRYIEKHRLGDDKPVYVISILDNFSRAILASGISRTQNLIDYLIVLFAAIRQHGAPAMLVSDSGSIFKAKQAMKIYEEHLTIEFAHAPLAQYQVEYQPNKKDLRQVTSIRQLETPYRSPQLSLWEQGGVEWHQVIRETPYEARKRTKAVTGIIQQSLFP